MQENKEMQTIKEYREWRANNFINKTGFFPIFSMFDKKMINISPGAIKLYIFIGMHSNYDTGTSFYSISKLAIILKKTNKTISNWIKELEENDLIYRKQKRLNGVSVTYLRPYGGEKNDK